MTEPSNRTSGPDDEAVLAGAEVEVPATETTPVRHTTRTLADVDPGASTPGTSRNVPTKSPG